MTPPTTPREKVEPSLDDLLRKAVETMKSWTPERREAHFEAQKKAWVAAEMAFGDEGTRAVTALASGSGDHAELARLAEAASARLAGPILNADGFGLQIWGDSLKGGSTHVLDVRGWGYLTGGGHGALGLSEDDGIAAQRAIQAYAVAAWNAVPALLSEIAALRGELKSVEINHDIWVEIAEERQNHATQAERQRDEAVGLLRELADGRSQKNNINEYDDLSVRASALIANQGADQ